MAMLEMVKRSSMDRGYALPGELQGLVQSAVHADPADQVEDDVLAADRGWSFPFNTTLMAAGTLNHSRPVAMAAAISVEPTPVENAPTAP